MTKQPAITETASRILSAAADRPDRLVQPPTIPAAAAKAVIRSMLNKGFIEEVPAKAHAGVWVWREDPVDGPVILRATDAGFAAAGITLPSEEPPGDYHAFVLQVGDFVGIQGCPPGTLDEPEVQIMLKDGFQNGRPAGRVAGDILAWCAEADEEAEVSEHADDAEDIDDLIIATEGGGGAGLALLDGDRADGGAEDGASGSGDTANAPTVPTGSALRAAAQAVLDAWDDETNRETDIIGAMEAPIAVLRAALAAGGRRTATQPRAPRADSKQEQVLAMLRQEAGATIDEICSATGWMKHTVRGFFAAQKKKGSNVERRVSGEGGQKISVYYISQAA